MMMGLLVGACFGGLWGAGLVKTDRPVAAQPTGGDTPKSEPTADDPLKAGKYDEVVKHLQQKPPEEAAKPEHRVALAGAQFKEYRH